MKFAETIPNAIDIAWMALIILTAWIYWRLSRHKKPVRPGRQKPGKLFSAEERQLFLVLERAFQDDYVVLGKIRLADLIVPAGGSPGKPGDPGLPDTLAGLCIPFVLCRRNDLSVACLLRVIPRPGHHRQKPRHGTDAGLAAVCQAAGLPLVSFQEGEDYDIPRIRALVTPAMEGELLFSPESTGRREPLIPEVEKLKL